MSVELKDLIITEQFYEPHVTVPWHYHENAHLSYHIRGNVKEVSKKMTYDCAPSTILYHHSQDPHYNCRLSPDVQIFHVEFKPKWFMTYAIRPESIEGSIQLDNPVFKYLMGKIYRETKISDPFSQLSIEGLLLQIMAEMLRRPSVGNRSMPTWVAKVNAILHSNIDNINLGLLSKETQVHPVQLSREFPKYFGSSFGEYIRNNRLEKAVKLMADKSLLLTEIAFRCGFSDQSHFIRIFKQKYGKTPAQYRKD